MSVTEFNTPQPEHVELNVCKDDMNHGFKPKISQDSNGLGEQGLHQVLEPHPSVSSNGTLQEIPKTGNFNPMAVLLAKESSNLSDCFGEMNKKVGVNATSATTDYNNHNTNTKNNNNNKRTNESVVDGTELRSSQGSMGYGTKELLSPPMSPNINNREADDDYTSKNDTLLFNSSDNNKPINHNSYLLLTPQSHHAQLSTHPMTHKSLYQVHGGHTAFNDNSFDGIFLQGHTNDKETQVPCKPDHKISANKPLVADLQWSNKDYSSDLKFFISKYRNYKKLKNGIHMNNRLERTYYTRSNSNIVDNYTNGENLNGNLTNNSVYSNTFHPVRSYRTRLRTIAEGNKDYEPQLSARSIPKKLVKTTHTPGKITKQHIPKPHVAHQPLNEWKQMQDYAPPLASLDNIHNGNSKGIMKVEWKGSTMDLSEDPLRDKLHPAELQLASILRLSCDSYLASKRRLFMEKVSKLKRGQGFRRTDAQKVCRIDVNKASRLYQAFEKVGWLDDKNFVKFL